MSGYDQLLPTWNRLIHFTITVLHKEPKKSKYSDAAHRFSSREYDWGWKNFLEFSELSEGFITNNSLVVELRLEILQDNSDPNFLMIDPSYKGELYLVYILALEQLFHHFLNASQNEIKTTRYDFMRYDFWWRNIHSGKKCHILLDRMFPVLTGLFKYFSHDNDVISTLIMDALCHGLKNLEETSLMIHKKYSSDGFFQFSFIKSYTFMA